MASTSAPKEPAWHDSLPPPQNQNPGSITREELLAWFSKSPSVQDFVLVDLRRTDYVGGTIQTSINLPAQSLYHTIPTLYSIFKAAKTGTVVWYCGSSRGRGTRAAGWFDDYIKSQGDHEMKSIILEGGITSWADAGEKYVKLIDGYEESAWTKD